MTAPQSERRRPVPAPSSWSPPEIPDRVRQHVAFIDAAVDAGVERLVYVSFFGASSTATFTLARDHWATEEHLRSVGVAHTILRDNIYADFTPHLIGTDGNIRGPARRAVAVVAQADIAEVAVAVLTSDGAYDGRTLNLTGPEAVTMYEIADIRVIISAGRSRTSRRRSMRRTRLAPPMGRRDGRSIAGSARIQQSRPVS